MKIYVVYFRTMVDSPDTEILSVTTSQEVAFQKLDEARKREEAFMSEVEDDSSTWAEADMAVFDGDFSAGDSLCIVIKTEWMEVVATEILPFMSETAVIDYISREKKRLLEENPELVPFDDDETIEESLHLCDEDLMEDIYFDVESYQID